MKKRNNVLKKLEGKSNENAKREISNWANEIAGLAGTENLFNDVDTFNDFLLSIESLKEISNHYYKGFFSCRS